MAGIPLAPVQAPVQVPVVDATAAVGAMWGTMGAGSSPPPAVGFKRPITIADPGVDQPDLPVIVNLTSSNFSGSFAKCKSDGSDIRVYDSNGTNPLKFFIEFFDQSNSRASLIVRTSLTNGATKTIYITYGNAALSDASDATATLLPPFTDSGVLVGSDLTYPYLALPRCVQCVKAGTGVGDLLVPYRAGPTHLGEGVLKMMRLTAGVWSGPTAFWSEGGVDARPGGMFVTHTGRIIFTFFRENSGTGAVISASYVYSDDNGATWSAVQAFPNVFTGAGSYTANYGKGFEIHSGGVYTLYQGGYGQNASESERGCMWKSTDDGLTWTAIGTNSGAGGLYVAGTSLVEFVFAPTPADSATWLAWGRTEAFPSTLSLWQTTNSGVTWTLLNATWHAGQQPDLAVMADNPNHLLLTFTRDITGVVPWGMLFSPDGGTNWSACRNIDAEVNSAGAGHYGEDCTIQLSLANGSYAAGQVFTVGYGCVPGAVVANTTPIIKFWVAPKTRWWNTPAIYDNAGTGDTSTLAFGTIHTGTVAVANTGTVRGSTVYHCTAPDGSHKQVLAERGLILDDPTGTQVSELPGLTTGWTSLWILPTTVPTNDAVEVAIQPYSGSFTGASQQWLVGFAKGFNSDHISYYNGSAWVDLTTPGAGYTARYYSFRFANLNIGATTCDCYLDNVLVKASLPHAFATGNNVGGLVFRNANVAGSDFSVGGIVATSRDYPPTATVGAETAA